MLYVGICLQPVTVNNEAYSCYTTVSILSPIIILD